MNQATFAVLAPQLNHLDLSRNPIGDSGVIAIAAELHKCSNLTSLTLSWTGTGIEGCRAIAAALPKCPTLTSLFFDWNKIGDEGAIALAAALKRCPNLVYLSVLGNCIGDSGFKAISAALKSSRLKSINFGWNTIHEDGAEAIAVALERCPSLEHIRLSRNNIGDKEAQVIARGLENNIHLNTLDLSNNQIGPDGYFALVGGYLRSPAPLRVFAFDGNVQHYIHDNIRSCLGRNAIVRLKTRGERELYRWMQYYIFMTVCSPRTIPRLATPNCFVQKLPDELLLLVFTTIGVYI